MKVILQYFFFRKKAWILGFLILTSARLESLVVKLVSRTSETPICSLQDKHW